jgi:hypothetical protein
MTHAEYQRILALPRQIAAAKARLAQIDRSDFPVDWSSSTRRDRRQTVLAKLDRLRARAAALGLRDLAQ